MELPSSSAPVLEEESFYDTVYDALVFLAGGNITTSATSRSLYDADYLASSCNSTLYDPNHAVDNLLSTAITSYVVAVVLWFIGLCLVFVAHRCCNTNGSTDGNAIQWRFLVASFIILGLGYAIGGLARQVTDHKSEDFIATEALGWVAVLISLVGSFCLLMAEGMGFDMEEAVITTPFCTVIGVTHFAALVFIVVQQTTNIIPIQVGKDTLLEVFLGLAYLGLIVRYTVLELCGQSLFNMKDPFPCWLGKTMGLSLVIAGVVLVIWLAPLCGDQAYVDCFAQCPLQVAHVFNQQGLFNCLAALGYFIYGMSLVCGCGKQETMARREDGDVEIAKRKLDDMDVNDHDNDQYDGMETDPQIPHTVEVY